MAYETRKTEHAMILALVAAHNASRKEPVYVGTYFHGGGLGFMAGDPMSPVPTARTVSVANASDLATALVLVNALRSVYIEHIADDVDVHLAKDTTNTISAPVATDLATAITLANEIKADYGAHRTQSGVHFNDDSTNTVSASNATDQSSLNTLLNELKTDLNAHMASKPAGFGVKLVAP